MVVLYSYPNLKTDEVFRGRYSSSPFTVDYKEGIVLKRRYLVYPDNFQPIPALYKTLFFTYPPTRIILFLINTTFHKCTDTLNS